VKCKGKREVNREEKESTAGVKWRDFNDKASRGKTGRRVLPWRLREGIKK